MKYAFELPSTLVNTNNLDLCGDCPMADEVAEWCKNFHDTLYFQLGDVTGISGYIRLTECKVKSRGCYVNEPKI